MITVVKKGKPDINGYAGDCENCGVKMECKRADMLSIQWDRERCKYRGIILCPV